MAQIYKINCEFQVIKLRIMKIFLWKVLAEQSFGFGWVCLSGKTVNIEKDNVVEQNSSETEEDETNTLVEYPDGNQEDGFELSDGPEMKIIYYNTIQKKFVPLHKNLIGYALKQE